MSANSVWYSSSMLFLTVNMDEDSDNLFLNNISGVFYFFTFTKILFRFKNVFLNMVFNIFLFLFSNVLFLYGYNALSVYYNY